MIATGLVVATLKTLISGEDPSATAVLKKSVIENGALIPYYRYLDTIVKEHWGDCLE